MALTRNQKKEMVIKLYEDGKTTREIAKSERMSLRDIGIILREHNKEPEPEKPKSERSRAYQMFLTKETPTEVAIEIDLEYDETMQYHSDFLKMEERAAFARICEEYDPYLPFIMELIEQFRGGNLNKTDMSVIARYIKDKKNLEMEIQYLKHEKARLIYEKKDLNGEFSDGRIPSFQNRDQFY